MTAPQAPRAGQVVADHGEYELVIVRRKKRRPRPPTPRIELVRIEKNAKNYVSATLCTARTGRAWVELAERFLLGTEWRFSRRVLRFSLQELPALRAGLQRALNIETGRRRPSKRRAAS